MLSPKSWLEFTGEWAPRMDVVIALDESVGGHHAPVFPGEPLFLDWVIADPLSGNARDDEQARLFDKTFWQIVRQVSAFIELPQYAANAVSGAKPVRGGGATHFGASLVSPTS